MTGVEVGQRVHVTLRRASTWREEIRVPASAVYPAPEGGDPAELSLVNGGALIICFALGDFVELQPGDRVIQDSANFNCGRYRVSFAKLWGYKTPDVVPGESG